MAFLSPPSGAQRHERGVPHVEYEAGGSPEEKVLQMLEVLVQGQARVEALLRRIGPGDAPAAVSAPALAVAYPHEDTAREPGGQREFSPQLLGGLAPEGRRISDPTPQPTGEISPRNTDSDGLLMTKNTTLGGSLRRQSSVSDRLAESMSLRIAEMRPRIGEQIPGGEQASMPDLIRVQSSALRRLVVSNDVHRGEFSDKESAESSWALHPESRGRLALDICGLVLIAYDLLFLPVQMAWNIPYDQFTKVMLWITFLFWMCDTLVGFFSGYYTRGKVVLHNMMIVKHYLRTTFVPCFLAVVADAVTLFMLAGETGPHSVLGKPLRLLRLPRVLRMYSVLKSGSAFKFYYDRMLRHLHFGRHFSLVMTMLKLSIFMLWACHVVACIWRVVGERSMDMFLDENALPPSPDTYYDWFLHLYWSINVLIAANPISVPRTKEEFAFACVCEFASLFGSSILIGIVGDTLLEFRMVHKKRLQQLARLRRYLNQSPVSSHLASSVERQAVQMFDHPRIVEEDVELLKNISPLLNEALRCQVFRPAVRTQVFIRSCEATNSMLSRDVCARALERELRTPGQVVFQRGDRARGAHLVHWGDFEYMRPVVVSTESKDLSFTAEQGFEKVPSSQVKTDQQVVGRCQWMCELALFCQWRYVGAMRATSNGEVLLLDGQMLTSIMQQDLALCNIVSEYAHSLARALKRNPERLTSELTMPISHEEIVLRMEGGLREEMSGAGLDLLSDRSRRRMNARVMAGECDLVVRATLKSWNGDLEEELQSVQLFTSLRMTREDGKMLVQLGTMEGDELRPDVGLPSTQVLGGELVAEALQRMLDGPMAKMKPFVIVLGKEGARDEEPPPPPLARGVRARRIGHVYGAELRDWDPTGRELLASELNIGPIEMLKTNLDTSESFSRWKTLRPRSHLRAPADVAEQARRHVLSAFLLDDDAEPARPVYVWLHPTDLACRDLMEGIASIVSNRLRSLAPRSPLVGHTRSL